MVTVTVTSMPCTCQQYLIKLFVRQLISYQVSNNKEHSLNSIKYPFNQSKSSQLPKYTQTLIVTCSSNALELPCITRAISYFIPLPSVSMQFAESQTL